MLPIDYHLRWVFLFVPEHPDAVSSIHDELISCTRITQPPAEMLLFRERFDVWRLILVIYPTFTPVPVDVGKLVHSQSVFLVEGSAVQGFGGSNGLLRSLILHKSESGMALADVMDAEPTHVYPSDIFLSLRGMKMDSSFVFPTVLSFRSRNLISFCLLSSGTIGRPSMTTNASRPSSSRTSYCSLKSACSRSVEILAQAAIRTHRKSQSPHPRRRNPRRPEGCQSSGPYLRVSLL